MDEVKAERLVQAVEKIATYLEIISKHLESTNKKKPLCKRPQVKEKKSQEDEMSDEQILQAVKNLPDDTGFSNPYPEPNK
jgi:hypothetical protein